MNSDVQVFTKDSLSEQAAASEARHLHAVGGRGIVPLHELGVRSLTLEKASCSLADVLHERGALAEGEVRAVGAEAAAALARVHDTGRVHGDIKPANLLLSRGGELWLADFDAACPADGRPLQLHSPGRVTPGAPAHFATDMAALAATLVELCTGVLLDPQSSWRAADLHRLGCSPALSAELSFMMAGNAAALSAERAALMLARDATGGLPEPAANVQRADSTPTVEFMPARRRAASPPPAQATSVAGPKWWRRLAASWRPQDAATRTSELTPRPCNRMPRNGRGRRGSDPRQIAGQ